MWPVRELPDVEGQEGGALYPVTYLYGEVVLLRSEQEYVALPDREIAADFGQERGGFGFLTGGHFVHGMPLAYADGIVEAEALRGGQSGGVDVGHRGDGIVVAFCPAPAYVLAQPAQPQGPLDTAQAGVGVWRYEEGALVDVDGCVGHRVDAAVGVACEEFHKKEAPPKSPLWGDFLRGSVSN